MMTLALDAQQQSAVDAPLDGFVAIEGRAGTGKSTALAARIERARTLEVSAQPLVAESARRLQSYAFELLATHGAIVQRIDDVEAELLFASACESLFELQWPEFEAAQLDPEIPGLRSPERFLESAFRLIRKLRDACIDPEEFLSRSLSGATDFYAKPPNLAEPKLLAGTKQAYQDSLDVTAAELQRQYRREIDLAKVLAKLYGAYVDLVAERRLMTGRDAIISATKLLRDDPQAANALRAAHRFAFVDRAEDLSPCETAFLAAIFGDAFEGVTLCGDGEFPAAGTRIQLRHEHRPKASITLHRAKTLEDEAAFVADRIREWLDAGAPADTLAVISRSVQHVEAFERALLERDVPAIAVGDVNVFADRRALDALALLFNAYDPFRHDWLLRTLSNRALALSDASLAILCNEPDNAQAALFVADQEPAPTARASRWDPKRDLRLGWNVVRGDRDDALTPQAKERLQRFRALRLRWIEIAETASLETFARTVWSEGLAREGAPDSASARAQQVVLARLLARLTAFSDENPRATLGEILDYAERRSDSDLESCEGGDVPPDFVRIVGVDAARGCEFERAVVIGAAPGTFPRWYAPDTFLFSLRLGMIPKENAGEGAAARTAKFTYYVHRIKAREQYNQRERRAFVNALRRVREAVVVTAHGRATRGITAPEFLEELR
ncbi:MAG TPA: 3'-5' exonuclease [Candidatus Cybelea sp.]|nr:3'-5' exonuclease [Candidatus Cybelea sp.]